MPLNKIQQQMLEQQVQDRLNKVDEHTTQLAENTIQVSKVAPEVDYTLALQRAIDKAKLANSSRIIIPQNVELTSDMINVSGLNNCVIDGGTIKLNYKAGANVALFNITTSNNITFKNMRIVGVSDFTTAFDGNYPHNAFYATSSSFIKIIDCTFEKFTSQAIYAINMSGGTYTEGLRVQGCIFRDFSYDAAALHQYAVFLDNDAEYSYVLNNQFYRVPFAIKCRNGANSIIDGNTIMKANNTISVSDETRALIYCEHLNNGGKITISKNMINHNESDVIPILCKGVSTNQERAFRIIDNNILINGMGAVEICIYLKNAYNSQVRGNFLSPVRGATQGAIRVTDSTEVTIGDNFINGGNTGILLNGGSAVIYNNNKQSDGTKLTAINGAVVKTISNVYGVVISDVGGIILSDATTWTVAKTATGTYKITHNMNSLYYTVTVTPEITAIASAARTANDITLTFKDLAGALVDCRFNVEVKLNQANLLYA